MKKIAIAAVVLFCACALHLHGQATPPAPVNCQPSVEAQQPQSNTTLNVLYTSRLLGYIRSVKNDPYPATAPFENSLNAARTALPDAFLIGMGDNLAPEYASRFEGDNAKPRVKFTQEQIRNDNVVRVLYNSHYDAIVPGKEDFYFGATRLAAVAQELPALNASNLSETAVYAIVPPDPNEHPPHGFVSSHPNAKPFDSGHIVIDRFKGRHAAYSIEFANKEPNAGSLRLRVCYADDPATCSDPIPVAIPPTDVHDGKVLTYDLSKLSRKFPSGERVLMCFDLSRPLDISKEDWQKDHGHQYCHPVSVDASMFPNFPYLNVQNAKKKGSHIRRGWLRY